MYGYSVSGEMSSEERERLILEHLPQVRLIARRIQERLPESISLDDLVSTGVLGLISAIDNFDASHNVKLKTYAEYKIRGAILDSLRGLDWAPRQKRRKSKQIEAAISLAEQRLHASPSEDEIAAELGISLEEYHEWLVEIRGSSILPAWSTRVTNKGGICFNIFLTAAIIFLLPCWNVLNWSACWRQASIEFPRSSAPS